MERIHPIGVSDVHEAAARISSHVVRTPLVPCEAFSQEVGCEVCFKAENLQHAGAFKTRGAVNAVFTLNDGDASCGVVTHSSGNHAAALARAARLREIPAHVVMPSNSAEVKIAAVRSYGVEPTFCEPNAAARAEMAENVRRETNATLIHPYDDRRVIAGQGTVALELIHQWPELDVVLVPVGGGGLLAGILTVVKELRPQVQVVAVEPAWADDAFRSMRSGRIEQPTRYDTIADGLRTPLGQLTFPIMRQFLDDLILVSESAILRAAQQIMRHARLIAEPSGAVTAAALLEPNHPFRGQRVAVVISGGNLDTNDAMLWESVRPEL